MQGLRPLGAVLLALATMNAPEGQWQTGEAVPDLRLPRIGSSKEGEREDVDLLLLARHPCLVLEFASW